MIEIPKSCEHFKRWADSGIYQHDRLKAAVKLTPRRGVAIDIGAHVGFWRKNEEAPGCP